MTRRPRRVTVQLCAGFAALLLAAGTPDARAARPLHASTTPAGAVNGTVVDQTGAAVEGARVSLLDAANVELRRADTDAQGSFTFDAVAASSYVVAVSKSGFRETRHVLRLAAGEQLFVRLRLDVGELRESVTVTPARGEPQEVFDTPEAVTVTTRQDFARRAHLLLPQALKETHGVHLQQTTAAQGSPFLRGLTGQQVLHLLAGVRFNNSTFRPGANQYTALIEPSFAERVEVVRGPNSTPYGSDSLGGTINVLTRPTGIGSERFELRGELETFFRSADLAAGGAARLSGGGPRWGFVVGASGLRAQDLRAGGGLDSHSVVTRLLGISSKALGSRLQDTGFAQYGGHAKFVAHVRGDATFSAEYLRGAQHGVRRYDHLDGGTGNLLSRFDPQTLDFASARYTRAGLGPLTSLSLSFSYNGQRDDRTSQSINNPTGLRSRITDEFNRTDVFGYQAQATAAVGPHSLSFGGEFYDEFITSRRTEARFQAATGGFTDVSSVRARFPNGARYSTTGLFIQDIARLTTRLTGTFGLRFSRFTYRQSPADNPRDARGRPTVPAFRTTAGDLTFNAGFVATLTRHLNLTANVSRGFRAPNTGDFGAVGLSGLGFEVTPEEGMRLGASVGNFDAVTAPSFFRPVEQLRPETLYNYEGGLRLRAARLSATASVFNAEFSDFIERRVLLLPPGAVGSTAGGELIVRQDASGAVYTALASAPVFVRANAGHVRLRGAESAFALGLTRSVSLNAHASYVRGVNTQTGAPPSLENGIPPLHGFASVRWEPAGRPIWVEVYTSFAAAQSRLSDNDLQQARIGGVRTREEITNFFNGGAVARGLVRDARLVETGETLAEVLRRVLGPDLSARVPLFTRHHGFATLNARGRVRLGERTTVTLILENIFDRNYRTMGSGVDAPGVNAFVRFAHGF